MQASTIKEIGMIFCEMISRNWCWNYSMLLPAKPEV